MKQRLTLGLVGLLLALVGCAGGGGAGGWGQAVVLAGNCREFRASVVIGGRLQMAHGTACRQPDGEWAIVQPGRVIEVREVQEEKKPRMASPPARRPPPPADYESPQQRRWREYNRLGARAYCRQDPGFLFCPPPPPIIRTW